MLPRYHLLDSFRITQKEYTFIKHYTPSLDNGRDPDKVYHLQLQGGFRKLRQQNFQLSSSALCVPSVFLLFPFFALLYCIFIGIILSNTFTNVKDFGLIMVFSAHLKTRDTNF